VYVILARIMIGLKSVLTCDYRAVFLLFFFLQPREIKEIKDFLLKARRKDAKCK